MPGEPGVWSQGQSFTRSDELDEAVGVLREDGFLVPTGDGETTIRASYAGLNASTEVIGFSAHVVAEVTERPSISPTGDTEPGTVRNAHKPVDRLEALLDDIALARLRGADEVEAGRREGGPPLMCGPALW